MMLNAKVLRNYLKIFVTLCMSILPFVMLDTNVHCLIITSSVKLMIYAQNFILYYAGHRNTYY